MTARLYLGKAALYPRINQTHHRSITTRMYRYITEDKERYKICIETFLKNSIQNHECYEWLTENIIPIAKDACSNRHLINMISNGSGEGKPDDKILQKIVPEFKRIIYTAIDSDSDRLNVFKQMVTSKAEYSKVEFQTRETTYEKFLEGGPGVEVYNFIHFIHSLYFVSDVESLLCQYYELLAPGGVILALHNIMGNHNFRLMEGFSDIPRAVIEEECNLENYCLKLGFTFKKYYFPYSTNVGTVFMGLEEGDQILDFLTCTPHFRMTSPPETVTAFIQRLEKNSTILNGVHWFTYTLVLYIIKKPVK